MSVALSGKPGSHILYIQIYPAYLHIIEGSLTSKLPEIWTDEKSRDGKSQRREGKKKEDQKRESLRRKKIQAREKVGKSRNTVFFQ